MLLLVSLEIRAVHLGIDLGGDYSTSNIVTDTNSYIHITERGENIAAGRPKYQISTPGHGRGPQQAVDNNTDILVTHTSSYIHFTEQGENIVAGRPVYQSSTSAGQWGPALAVDGNTASVMYVNNWKKPSTIQELYNGLIITHPG